MAMVGEMILKGLIAGFVAAVPIGPVGTLCIKRSLTHGRLSGFCTGMGVATADTIYGSIAAFGLAAISNFLLEHEVWMEAGGAAFLLYIGIKIFFERPAANNGENSEKTSLIKNYLSGLGITLANPLTIVLLAAIFAALGLGDTLDYWAASFLVLGVFIGSGIWWVFLSNFAAAFKKTFTENRLIWMNRITGAIIVLFALAMAMKIVLSF
jgi:threonine/homoserine/homoserine lactone efflux protein